MTSHTPGPWGLMEHRDGYYALTPPDGRCSYFGKLPCQDAEDHANAALISAAPDLLRVVQDLMSDIIDLSTLSGDDVSSCHYLYDAARAAITKATKGQ